ncbi:MAG: MspA family porin [Mycobacteriaceae bacterium]
MSHRVAPLIALCCAAAVAAAGPAIADPPADPALPPPVAAAEAPPIPPAPAAGAAPPAPPVDTGAVASEVPGIAKTLDGRTLTVVGKDETQLPIAPLTTSLAARDWLVGGTFTGMTTGDVAGGTLEVGYQIGCGVEMDKVKLNGGLTGILGNTNFGGAGVILPPSVSIQGQGQFEVEPRPGTITNMTVDKKSFKGTSARVTIRDVHIKVDNCVGASSLRSYAVLTSSATDDDDVVAYYGVAKVF